MMIPMTPDVEAILAELDGHRLRFTVLCRSLTSEELDRPVPQSSWIVRDFIAHLATIDAPVAGMFRTIHEGGDAGIRGNDGAPWDVDRWNEAQVQQRRGLTVDQLLFEAAEQRTALRNQLARLTEDDLDRTIKFGGDARRPPSEIALRSYLRGWCKHDVMHAVDMARAFPEKISARTAEWFADPVVAMYQKSMNGPA